MRATSRRGAGLAVALTGPLAAAYDMPPESIALYFLDRAPDEVAHGGRLSADVPA